MNDPNISRLRKWTRNGAIVGLVAAFLNLALLGKGGYEPFSIMNFSYIFGHVAGAAVLGLLATAVINMFTKK